MNTMNLKTRSHASSLIFALALAAFGCDSTTSSAGDAAQDLGRDGGRADRGADGADAGDGDAGPGGDADTEDASAEDPDAAPSAAPRVLRTNPVDGAMGVALNRPVTITFSEAMDPATIDTMSFHLTPDAGTAVAARVVVSGARARLEPMANLLPNTTYTAKITEDAQSLAGRALDPAETWSFVTGDTVARGPAPVQLGMAGRFVVLAKAGIDTIPASVLTGDIGVSPIDSTALTGFSLSVHASGVYSTSDQVVGRAFAADYAVPTPSNLTTAVSDMQSAYSDAAGRAIPDFTELGSGDISGLTLAPGLYKWGTGVLISTDVTLEGGPDDVWIFQISGGITQAAGARMILAGGARPHNIFWQAFGGVAIDTTAHFEGVLMAQTEIALATGATMNGRLLSQTAVTLDASRVTEPAR